MLVLLLPVRKGNIGAAFNRVCTKSQVVKELRRRSSSMAPTTAGLVFLVTGKELHLVGTIAAELSRAGAQVAQLCER